MTQEEKLNEAVNALKMCADLFMDIRMDWSDPRYECRAGMSIATNTIQHISDELYIPRETNKL